MNILSEKIVLPSIVLASYIVYFVIALIHYFDCEDMYFRLESY